MMDAFHAHAHAHARLAAALLCALGAALPAACVSPPPLAPQPASAAAPATLPPAAAVARTLAPSGRLRIGVYHGSPTSLLRTAGGEQRGVTVEVGQALARQLGVPGEIVVFDRVALVVDAIATGLVDMTVTNASPARAEVVDFTPPLLAIELGVLVMPGSPVASVNALDRPGIRVGVTQGSSTQATLAKRLAQASTVGAASTAVAQDLLRSGRVDAYATNKAVLYEMGDGLPGSRVLDGRWGLEHLAIAIPQGRGTARAWLAAFCADLRRDGTLERAAQRAGLRGAVPVEDH